MSSKQQESISSSMHSKISKQQESISLSMHDKTSGIIQSPSRLIRPCCASPTMLKYMYHEQSPNPMPLPHCYPPLWLDVMLQCMSDSCSSQDSVKPCPRLSSIVAANINGRKSRTGFHNLRVSLTTGAPFMTPDGIRCVTSCFIVMRICALNEAYFLLSGMYRNTVV